MPHKPDFGRFSPNTLTLAAETLANAGIDRAEPRSVPFDETDARALFKVYADLHEQVRRLFAVVWSDLEALFPEDLELRCEGVLPHSVAMELEAAARGIATDWADNCPDDVVSELRSASTTKTETLERMWADSVREDGKDPAMRQRRLWYLDRLEETNPSIAPKIAAVRARLIVALGTGEAQ